METQSDAAPVNKLAFRHLEEGGLVLAQIECREPNKLIEQMRQAVAAGEQQFGPDYVEENVGRFWGLLETRPYMRARARST